MLLLEEPDSVASNWRKSIRVRRLTVGSLEERLGRLVNSGGGDGMKKHSAQPQYPRIVSKQEVVKLVAAHFTAEIREQSLGVAANTRDEFDICLLSSCRFPVSDKQLHPSLAAVKQAVVAVATA